MMIAMAALFMSTSVTTDTSMTYYGRASARDVYNLGLLQHQLMVFVGGLGVAIAGVVVASAGTIIEHLVPVAPTAAIKAVPPLQAADATEPAASGRTDFEIAEENRDSDRFIYLVAGCFIAVVAAAFAIMVAIGGWFIEH